MAQTTQLSDSFKQTKFQISGHGPRNLQVLKNALTEISGDIDSDIYGKGPVIEEFEQKMASFLGKEKAVFFPSGTMAQQIALRIWCDEQDKNQVAYHPLCHLEIHEEDGLKQLHQIRPVLLATKDRLIDIDDVLAMPKEVCCLLLELPQREIGGQLPDYETLVSISHYCRKEGIRLHLDGARLFEVLPYYNRSAPEICQLFDSVYVSFYKGLGGIAGAILAGDESFVAQSIVWKRRHGGDLISLYPYIVAADYYFDRRIHKMGQYYEQATQLAMQFNECPRLSTVPQVPVCNMFHVLADATAEALAATFAEVHRETGIGFTSTVRSVDQDHCYFEVSVGEALSIIPQADLRKTFELLADVLTRRP